MEHRQKTPYAKSLGSYCSDSTSLSKTIHGIADFITGITLNDSEHNEWVFIVDQLTMYVTRYTLYTNSTLPTWIPWFDTAIHASGAKKFIPYSTEATGLFGESCNEDTMPSRVVDVTRNILFAAGSSYAAPMIGLPLDQLIIKMYAQAIGLATEPDGTCHCTDCREMSPCIACKYQKRGPLDENGNWIFNGKPIHICLNLIGRK